jgi:hypothetical protein
MKNKSSIWFNRMVPALATVLFTLIGVRYVIDPIGAVAPHQTTIWLQ